MKSEIILLFIGDIVGDIGLDYLVNNMPALKGKYKPDFLIANGENVWQGKGLNDEEAKKLFDAGFHVITTGNHIWENWKSRPLLSTEARVLRPLNYPPGNPGKGFNIQTIGDVRIATIQIQGRTFLQTIDCPFRGIDAVLKNIEGKADLIVVDFHAEATAEKMTMGWHLDGKVTAILGTHTHVQTADARILPEGTAFISDVGMTGPYDSVLGMSKDIAYRRVTLQTAHKFELASDDLRIAGAVVSMNPLTGQANWIENFMFPEFTKRSGVDL